MTRKTLLGWLLILGLAGCGRSSVVSDWTAMRSAVDAGNVRQTARLLRANPARVNADDGDGHTPLHLAADDGHTEVTALLLAHGAKLEAADSCGWTPLHTAAAQGRTATAELLISKGADVNAKDKRDQTPLALAVKWGHPEVAALLRANGGWE